MASSFTQSAPPGLTPSNRRPPHPKLAHVPETSALPRSSPRSVWSCSPSPLSRCTPISPTAQAGFAPGSPVSPVSALSRRPPTEDGRNEIDAPLATIDDLTDLINLSLQDFVGLSIQDLNYEKYVRMIFKLNRQNAAKIEQLLKAQVVVDKAIEACSQLARDFKQAEELVSLNPAFLARRVTRAARGNSRCMGNHTAIRI